MLVSWSWEWASCTIFSRAVVDIQDTNKVISFLIPNAQECGKEPKDFLTTKAAIEQKTGFKFYPKLNPLDQGVE